MPDSPPIGNAQLAQEVIERYADLNGLSPEECVDLEIEESRCLPLTQILSDWEERKPAPQDLEKSKTTLKAAGFSDEFIREFLGPDESGTRALKERLIWLGDHAVSKWWRIDDKPEVRALMVQKMGEIGLRAPGEALPSLIEALDEEEEYLALAAAEAIGNVGWEVRKAVSALLGKLATWPPNRMRVVIESLGKVGGDGKEVLSALVKALGNQAWEIRYAACKALGTRGISAYSASPSLIERLEGDPVWWVRQQAAWALGEIHKRETEHPSPEKRSFEKMSIQALIGKLGDPNPDVQEVVSHALVKTGPPAVQEVMLALSHQDPFIRARAAHTLGMMKEGATDSVRALIASLRDTEEEVREEAAWALGEIGHPASVVPLIRALGDESQPVQEAAVEALVKLGEDAIPEVIRSLGSDNPIVQRNALQVLIQTGQAKELIQALGDPGPQVRLFSQEALVAIGLPAVPELISALLKETNHSRLEMVIDTLTTVGKDAVPKLIEALGQASGPARLRLVRILSEIGADAMPGLLLSLHDKNPARRLGAAVALGKLGIPALSPLLALLGDKEESTRLAAAEGLATLGLLAIPALTLIVAKGKKPDADAAAYALVKIGEPVVASLLGLLETGDSIREVADIFLKIGPAIAPRLLEKLGSGESVREEIQTILDKMDPIPTDDLPRVFKFLNAPEGLVRMAALREIEKSVRKTPPNENTRKNLIVSIREILKKELDPKILQKGTELLKLLKAS